MPQASRPPWVPIVLLIAVGSCTVGYFSSRHLEELWDEQVDHDIAVALRDHPLTGEHPAIDASQMRLPMYVTAMIFKITGHDDLATARKVSLLAGGVAIVAAAALAEMLFGGWAAILTAALLGFSPYFLSFSRIAMTEGDVFFAATVTLAVWSFVAYLREPGPMRWLLAAIMLSLALGAKFFGIFLFLVFLVLATSSRREYHAASDQKEVRRFLRLLTAGLAVIALTLLVTYLLRRSERLSSYASRVAIAGWLVEWFISLAVLARVCRGNCLPRSAIARCLSLFAFSIMLCCTWMPVHMTEPDIAVELLRRTLHWDHQFPLALWSDHLRLYAGIVLIKLTIPLGIVTAIALIYAAFREREDGRWRPCILSVIFYIVLLCFLPLRQTFYLMGVYPLIVITLAGFICELARRWKVVVLLLTFGLAYLGYSGARAYPQYHLFGYEVVGDKWMGKESRGYRNLIQTPSDGVEELIHWCTTNVPPGSRVVSYLWEERIIESLLPTKPAFTFVPRGLSQESDAIPPPPDLSGADFVLVHINNILGYGDRPPDAPPRDVLDHDFHVVHTVQRGPLAVGWAYERNSGSRPRGSSS